MKRSAMKNLSLFLVLTIAVSGAMAQETAMVLTKVKNGKKVYIDEGDPFVFLDSRDKGPFTFYKKGLLLKATDGKIEYRPVFSDSVHTMNINDMIFVGYRRWSSVLLSVLHVLPTSSRHPGVLPVWPGTMFHKKNLSKGKWKIETGVVPS